MSWDDLKATIVEEVTTIFDSEFDVNVVGTRTVPHSGDNAITFPNFDTWTLGAKLIDTSVLYIDIRRSTDLNLSHRAHTVAKLYSAFIRAMTHVAQHHDGRVRGIIGDRLMVLFDSENSSANAVDCAITMNAVGKHVINKYFKANEVTFGIGIDCGKMLATKTGIRRHGYEQANYRNLVWLGRPANVASKLTDLAAKPSESKQVPAVTVAYERPDYSSLINALAQAGNSYNALSGKAGTSLLSGLVPQPSPGWDWQDQTLETFVGDLETAYVGGINVIRHKNPRYKAFIPTVRTVQIRPETPPILMTAAVWRTYRTARPAASPVKGNWFKPVSISVPGYAGGVFGGDVERPFFKT